MISRYYDVSQDRRKLRTDSSGYRNGSPRTSSHNFADNSKAILLRFPMTQINEFLLPAFSKGVKAPTRISELELASDPDYHYGSALQKSSSFLGSTASPNVCTAIFTGNSGVGASTTRLTVSNASIPPLTPSIYATPRRLSSFPLPVTTTACLQAKTLEQTQVEPTHAPAPSMSRLAHAALTSLLISLGDRAFLNQFPGKAAINSTKPEASQQHRKYKPTCNEAAAFTSGQIGNILNLHAHLSNHLDTKFMTPASSSGPSSSDSTQLLMTPCFPGFSPAIQDSEDLLLNKTHVIIEGPILYSRAPIHLSLPQHPSKSDHAQSSCSVGVGYFGNEQPPLPTRLTSSERIEPDYSSKVAESSSSVLKTRVPSPPPRITVPVSNCHYVSGLSTTTLDKNNVGETLTSNHLQPCSFATSTTSTGLSVTRNLILSPYSASLITHFPAASPPLSSLPLLPCVNVTPLLNNSQASTGQLPMLLNFVSTRPSSTNMDVHPLNEQPHMASSCSRQWPDVPESIATSRFNSHVQVQRPLPASFHGDAISSFNGYPTDIYPWGSSYHRPYLRPRYAVLLLLDCDALHHSLPNYQAKAVTASSATLIPTAVVTSATADANDGDRDASNPHRCAPMCFLAVFKPIKSFKGWQSIATRSTRESECALQDNPIAKGSSLSSPSYSIPGISDVSSSIPPTAKDMSSTYQTHIRTAGHNDCIKKKKKTIGIIPADKNIVAEAPVLSRSDSGKHDLASSNLHRMINCDVPLALQYSVTSCKIIRVDCTISLSSESLGGPHQTSHCLVYDRILDTTFLLAHAMPPLSRQISFGALSDIAAIENNDGEITLSSAPILTSNSFPGLYSPTAFHTNVLGGKSGLSKHQLPLSPRSFPPIVQRATSSASRPLPHVNHSESHGAVVSVGRSSSSASASVISTSRNQVHRPIVFSKNLPRLVVNPPITMDLPEPPPDYNSAISLNSHPKGFSNSTSSLSSTELSFSGQQTHFSTSLPSQSSNLIAMGTGCISRSGHRDMLSGSRLPVDIPTQTVPSGALSEPIVDTAEISPVDIKEDGIFLSSPSISVPIQNCSPIGTVPVPTRDVMVPVAENMSHVKLVISKLGGSVDRGFCYPKQSGVNKSQESLKPVPVAVDNSGNRDVKGRILQSKSGAGNVLRTEGECYSGGDFLPSNNNIVGASNLEEVLEINKAEMATTHQSDKEEKLEYPIISRLSRHSASRIPMRGLSSGRWPAIGACDPIKMQRQSFAPLSEVNWDSRSEEFWAPLFSIFP